MNELTPEEVAKTITASTPLRLVSWASDVEVLVEVALREAEQRGRVVGWEAARKAYGVTGFEGPLPKNIAEMIKLLKKSEL